MYPDSPWVVAQPEVPDEDVPVGGRGDVAERLLRRFLGLCESPRTRATMLRLVRASVRGGGAGRRLNAVLTRMVLSPVARATGVHTTATKGELVVSQLVGLAMMRYVLEIEPVASLPVDEIVVQMAPAVRAVLKG